MDLKLILYPGMVVDYMKKIRDQVRDVKQQIVRAIDEISLFQNTVEAEGSYIQNLLRR